MSHPSTSDFMPVSTSEFVAGSFEAPAGSLGALSAPTTWSNFICRSRHPGAAFFHIAFKVRARPR